MANFVHLAPESEQKRILKGGIKAQSLYWHGMKGVFCMPVLPDFYVTFQWLRELKRSGQRSYVGIQFKLPDQEVVYVGHYNKRPLKVSAAQAASIVGEHQDGLGLEVFIPRKIAANEIRRVRALPQKAGWRYSPTAKGTKPCACPACVPRGEINARKLRRWAENAASED